MQGWEFVSEGYCSSSSTGDVRLGSSIDSILTCQALCTGTCQYVSYARNIDKNCYGSVDCKLSATTGGNQGWNYYVTKKTPRRSLLVIKKNISKVYLQYLYQEFGFI